MADWFEEKLHDGFRTRLRIDELIYEGKSEHQHVQVFATPKFGRVMTLNDVVQTTERDEFVYHEMLSHVPILAHGKARQVLIIGGGDGGMMEEALKHRDVERVTLVEIDGAVIELAKQHFRSICGDAFEDPRADIVIDDGVVFVNETDRRYDVIIVDSTDPIGPGEVLFTQRFYAACKRCLTPGGILVTQNGVPFVQGGELQATVGILKPLFADAAAFVASVPIYAGGCMAFAWASDDPGLRSVPAATLRERFVAANLQGLRYYTPEVHAASFALPRYILDLIE